jgi:hypothetical protein
LVTSCAIHAWDPRIGSVNSLHATSIEYTKRREASVSGTQARYQQTHEYAIQGHNLVARSLAEFNQVGTTRDRHTNAVKNPWR